MFSIYSHVRNRNRPQSPDFDSDAQTPTPPPTFPAPRQSQSLAIPRPGQASSLPTPSRPSSRVDPLRHSLPAFTRPRPPIPPGTITFPSKASEPSTSSDEEEAAEAPAIEEFLAADSPDQDARWAKEAVTVKRELSPIQRPAHSPITPPSSKRDRLFHDHRGFLLSIKRSLRGRILSNAPVGDRTRRNLRYVSPFTPDELQDFYNSKRRRSAERVEAWVEEVGLEIPEEIPEIRERSVSIEPSRLRQGFTPEPKKQRQRRRSSPESSRHKSVRSGRVEKSERTGVAARRSKAPPAPTTPSLSTSALNKLATMLTSPTTPDTEIAPLVTTWTKALISKIDTLNTSLIEKDTIISSLEQEANSLSSNLEEANGKIKNLQGKLTRLEPDAGEIEAVRKQIEVLEKEKKGDQQKVQNLNIQLSTLVRQAKVDKKGFEKREGQWRELALKEQMKNEEMKNERMDREQMKNGHMGQDVENGGEQKTPSQQHEPAYALSPSVVQGGDYMELKAKYDALEKVAREVAVHCGLMAGDNFGPFGSALATLKRHMGE